SIKSKFWMAGGRPTAARNGGFGGLRPRADGAWAATGMAVEGLLEGERRMSTVGRAWPMPNGHDLLVLEPLLFNGVPGFWRFAVSILRWRLIALLQRARVRACGMVAG